MDVDEVFDDGCFGTGDMCGEVRERRENVDQGVPLPGELV